MDISNGEGIGIALFVQGCEFHCKGCFNQETWNFEDGEEWTNITKAHFFELADKPYIKRISILGGEPLHAINVLTVYNLCKEIKQKYPEKSIWLYTGYTLESFWINTGRVITDDFVPERVYRNEILQYIDVLVDGQFVEELKDLTLKFRGSSNQRLIDVQESLKQNKVVLWDK